MGRASAGDGRSMAISRHRGGAGGLPCLARHAGGTASRVAAAAAAILRRRRFELAAWEVYETAKHWREADADVAEAIDYCEYYAREMLSSSNRPPRRWSMCRAKRTHDFYEPRGVAVVIAPWNFPLAILCGMTDGGAGQRQHRHHEARRAVAGYWRQADGDL